MLISKLNVCITAFSSRLGHLYQRDNIKIVQARCSRWVQGKKYFPDTAGQMQIWTQRQWYPEQDYRLKQDSISAGGGELGKKCHP